MTRRSAGCRRHHRDLGVSVGFAADDPIKDRKELMMGNGKSAEGGCRHAEGRGAR